MNDAPTPPAVVELRDVELQFDTKKVLKACRSRCSRRTGSS
jgi:hypothetical protein